MGLRKWFADLVVKGRVQADAVHLTGSSDSETNEYRLEAVPGVGVRVAGGWIHNYNTINHQGNGNVITDGNLYLRSNGNKSLFMSSSGISVNQGTDPATAELDIKSNNGYDQLRLRTPYTATSTTDANGNTGTFAYDATNFYLKTANGWLVSPLFPLGAFPMGKLVHDRTFAGLQAAYDAAPDGVTTTLLLSGDYLRSGTTTLNLTSTTKTVWFKSYNGASIRDNNNTQSQAPMILINGQTGGGFDGVGFYMASDYQLFNYGMVFMNETAACTDYAFRRCKFSCPNLKGNGMTVQAWSQDNNSGNGGGCIHRGLTFEHCEFDKIGRMGLELTCHNEKETGIPTRIFDVTVRNCVVRNTGLSSKDGMGVSFSGSLENVIHQGNRYTNCRQYFVEFIGVRSGTTGGNIMLGGQTWGDGAKGSGDNKTNGYNFTDGGNSNLGAKNITVTGDQISVNGRPMLVYGCSQLSFMGGTWKGGQYLDINRGTKSDGSGAMAQDLTFDGVHCTITGDSSYNVLVVNYATRCQFLNMNLTSVGANGYSVINIYNTCSKILLSGGSWRRPTTSQDNMANLYATDSQPIGPHLESTF